MVSLSPTTAAEENAGAVSAAATAIVNVSVSASLSAVFESPSVTLYV